MFILLRNRLLIFFYLNLKKTKGKFLIQSIQNQKNDKSEIISKKIEILKEIELIEENCCFIVGMDGILNEEECLNMLQVNGLVKKTWIFAWK